MQNIEQPPVETPLLLKLVLKNGHVIAVFSAEAEVIELVSHPKFLKMRDSANDIYVSIEDVAAFEILNNRKEQPQPIPPQESHEQIPAPA